MASETLFRGRNIKQGKSSSLLPHTTSLKATKEHNQGVPLWQILSYLILVSRYTPTILPLSNTLMSGPCWPLSGETYPDDDIYIPCNQTAVDNGGHSACCAPGDRCLTNGLCTNDPGGNVYWRDGCTDRTWKDPACPNYCPSTGESSPTERS